MPVERMSSIAGHTNNHNRIKLNNNTFYVVILKANSAY